MGRDGVTVHSWEADSGLLRWEMPKVWSGEVEVGDLPLDVKWRPGGVVAMLAGARQGR